MMGLEVHGRGAVSRRLHHAAGARPVRQEDDEVARQRGRSAANHGAYGTDAVRFTLAQLSVQGRDLILVRRSPGGVARVRQQGVERGAVRADEPRGRAAAAPAAAKSPILRLPSDGSLRRWTMRSRRSAPRSIATNSTSPRCAPTASSGTSSVTGISSSPRSRSSRAASGRPRCAGCWCEASTGCSGCSIRSCPSSPKKSGRRCGRISTSPALAPHLAIAKFPRAAASDRAKPGRRGGDGACIAATEAINSLRSLLGYHPGQRVEARIRFLGVDSAAAEFRAEFERWKPYAATMAKAASLGLGRADGQHAGRDGDCGAGMVRGRGDGARGLRFRAGARRDCARSSTR